MAKIQAPFNFVPLSDKVYTPDWADKVSHDIPFEDGLDGSIDVTITAHSPIFVRNGKKTGEQDNSFCHTADGRYFIPGTTVKGAIRNVLEIMTNGKLIVDENAQFAQREWVNESLYTLRQNHDDVVAGWLYEDEDEKTGEITYVIEQSKAFYRINHRRLDEYLENGFFKKYFTKSSGTNINKPIDGEDSKTAFFKYQKLNGRLDGKHRFSIDNEYKEDKAKNRVRIDSSGDICGYIVLTGSPDQTDTWDKATRAKNRGRGKFYEFVFDADVIKEYSFDKKQFEHFKFIYNTKDSKAEWDFAQKRMREEGLPIFFRVQNGKIKDLGLAYLYKLPYENTPADIESRRQQRSDRANEKLDLAETIFGYTRGQEQLKGRVQFSHFFAENAKPDKQYTLILNSPKASYYPIYIKQDGRDGKTNAYKTYNDGQLKGFKRYHIRKNVWQKSMNNDKLDSTLIPLVSGTQFKGQINFHNLRPVELGALLSAITFHLNEDTNIYHQLGQGKPYGFGKVKFDVLLNCFEPKPNQNMQYFVAKFEDIMMSATYGSWLVSSTMKELFTIAHEEVTADDALSEYKYMNLGVGQGENEFMEVKNIKEFLKYYSQMSSANIKPKSVILGDLKQIIIEENEIEKARNEHEKLLQKQAQELAEQQAAEQLKAEAEAEVKRQAEERLKKAEEGGLSKLSTYVDFNRAKRDIDKYLKDINSEQIPENQIHYLEDFILRMYPQLRSREQKSWTNFDSAEWKKIKSYIPEQIAKAIFDKLPK